jgi:hypothetical protein
VTEFIVAEVSKTWVRGDGDRSATPPAFFIGAKFEKVIEFNRARGYVLYQFQLHRLMTDPDSMNETIVAVFRRVAEGG